MTDIEVLERQMECVRRKAKINCTNCGSCDLLMDDGRILAAYSRALDALRAKQKAEKNEPPVRCKDCVNWRQGETMGGYLPGELERLGTCHWIRGAFMATDFCSKAKRHPPEREEP